MKTIPSVYAQQAKRIEQLELALEKANAKIAELQTGQTTRSTIRRDSGHSSTRNSSRAPSNSPSASYTLPTASSTSKILPAADSAPFSKPIITSATVHGVDYYYVDGRIAEQHQTGCNTGYLKHTASSAEKTSRPWYARNEGITYTTKLRKDEAEWYGPEPEEPEDPEHGWSASDEPSEYPTINDENLNEVVKLEKASRLDDTSFYRTQAGQVNIRFDKQMFYLEEAFHRVQDTIFDAARERWPETWRKHLKFGPRSIRLGRDELNRTILGLSAVDYVHGVRIAPSYAIEHSLLEVVHLRNAVAHPGHKKPSQIDSLIANTQQLACSLQDTERAMALRQLRDRLQQQAKESLEDIIAYEPFSHLPEPEPWAVHHQHFFTDVNTRHGRSEETMLETYGAAVIRAAEAWELLYQDVGADDPVYFASRQRQDAECAEIAAKRALEDGMETRGVS